MGKVASAVKGFGDYQVGRNSLMSGGMSPPEIVNSTKSGGVIVRHREYLTDILSSVNFTSTQLQIQPGNPSSFPWLAAIAENFQEYKLRGMVFEFKSMSSDAVLSNATSSALGTVVFATDYNALDGLSAAPIFPDKITMENWEFSNSTKPSENMYHPIECAKNQTVIEQLYIRTGDSLPTSGDIRLYDFATFVYATQGQQAAGGTLGELWCTYEIELFKPKQVFTSGQSLLADHYQLAGVANATPVGITSAKRQGSNLGTTLNSGGTGLLFNNATIPDGNFLVVYQVKGTSAALSAPSLTAFNCSILSIWNGDTATLVSNNGTTSATLIMCFLVDITSVNSSILFGNGGTLPSTVTSGDLIVSQINGNLTT